MGSVGVGHNGGNRGPGSMVHGADNVVMDNVGFENTDIRFGKLNFVSRNECILLIYLGVLEHTIIDALKHLVMIMFRFCIIINKITY